MSITTRPSRRSADWHQSDALSQRDGDVTPPFGIPVTRADRAAALDPAEDARGGGSTEVRGAAARPAGGVRPFVVRYGLGAAAGSIVFLWVLGAGQVRPLRTALATRVFSDFYDLQARAFLSGRLDVPIGSLSIEGFRVRGQEFMYFPPWPAILRMPVLAVTDRFDGRLTALSMLLAFACFIVAAGVLTWNVRVILAADRPMSAVTAFATGAFAAVLGAGSTVTFLGALPWVYHEAYLWSIAGTVGTCAALLMVVRRPSARWIAIAGGAATITILSRTTSGWAMAGGVMAVGALLAIRPRPGLSWGRGVALVSVGATALLLGIAVNWAKFRHVYMFPLDRQVWTAVNAWRRAALRANGGSLTNSGFVPTTMQAYLRPDGIRFSTVFPWISLPAQPPEVVGDVVVDQRYRTGSVVAFMPLLVGFSAIGAVSLVRTRARDRWPLRMVALASITVAGPVLIYGYIAHRYSAEFVSGLVVLGAAGLPALDHISRPVHRRLAIGAIAVVSAFGVLATLAISVHATAVSSRGAYLVDLVTTRTAWSGAFGNDPPVMLTDQLPTDQPADQIVVVGDCMGVFLATGDLYEPWIPISLRSVQLAVTMTEQTGPYEARVVSLDGARDRAVAVQHDGRGNYRLAIVGNYASEWSDWIEVAVGSTIEITVTADTARGEYVLDAPGWVRSSIPVADWNRNWISVPNVLVPVTAADIDETGLALVSTWEPAPDWCRQWKDTE